MSPAAVVPVGEMDMLPPRKVAPSDLKGQVAELGASGKAAPAFDYVGSIKNHPQLSDFEKQSLLWVLAQSPCFHRLIQPADIGGHAMPDWVKCTGSGMLGIQIARQDPVAPERVYKMRGIAEIPASTEVTYELVTEFEHMQKWDKMLLNLQVLERSPKQYPILRIGTFINTYGVPGMSWLFNEREFCCRGVAAHFPDGTRALAVYTPAEVHANDKGVSKPRTIRAHMGVSGYVVSPYADEARQHLGNDKCQITMVLQVDPMGSVPLPVYNTVSMMMPMNLQRVKMAAAKLKPEEKAAMQQRQLQIVAASKAEAAAAAGGKGSKGGKKAK
ncbi:hypothetical protein OEZ85_010466 [Tetradesmus obliquus]|uniref:START domain-containing protein n=1 Tax=Tetradesmus obliquus TaxID=3088 RepID=A0ABY8TPH9_TETOB|nr:hypothetical protein OEZ85_010466 [Tetradesmus obliquus]